MKVAQLHIFIRHKKTRAETKRGEYKGRLERVIIKPDSQDIESMKLLIAETISKREKTAEYYYVVVAVRRPDRTIGYRNVIRKTVVA